MRWDYRFSKHNGTFALKEGWSLVVSNLSLKEGFLFVFKKTAPYTYLLTPFEKVHHYPTKLPMISMFTSISFERKFGCIDSFSRSFTDVCKDVLLIPKELVNVSIGVGKLKETFKIYVNQWDSFDVLLQCDPLRNCYFITDRWENVVHYMDMQTGIVLVLRYVADYIFLLTTFDLNGCEIVAPKSNDSPIDDTSSPNLEVPQITEDLDVEESSDTDSDSDYVVSNESSDDIDDADFDVAFSDYEVDPDGYPLQFVWYCSKHFRLDVKVASLLRIHRTLKMTVENLNRVDTVIDFRLEKHGKGFRYTACQFTKKFTKSNGIYRNMRCKFVYSEEKAKLILKKVYR
ncbi:putative transcription factor B3-Domain family [Helianthus annuus]|nr:putative transcription factor B3-Domain family [Helianthus annuus]